MLFTRNAMVRIASLSFVTLYNVRIVLAVLAEY